MHGYFATLMTNFIQGFANTRNIGINNTGANKQLENVQIKITLNSTNFNFSKAKSDGSDIRFYKGNQELKYYKELYNTATQTAVFYVKVNISSATNDNIQIYYGNNSLVNKSDWVLTMDRFQPNLYGGNTKYLLRFDEGTGTNILNIGSVGGNITVQNNWASVNNYGFTGSSLIFNGTNQSVDIPGLLDAYPIAGEISFSFKANSLSGSKTLLSKFNRLGTANPDFGDYFNLFVNSNQGNALELKINTSTSSARIYTPSPIVIDTLYKITIIWANGAIGLYLNGALIGREIFYKENGSAGVFKIGCFSNELTGVSNLFFNGSINDFRYTDYTTGQYPSLVQIEAEHNLTKFYPKDKRTKLNDNKYLITTNFPTGNMSNYKAEPFGMFDNGLFKLWYSSGDTYIHYRESTTSLGLKNATDQLVFGGGIGGETGDAGTHSLYKENGIYYMFYAPIQTTSLFVVTSNDGINWGNKQIALQQPSTGWGLKGFVNTWVVKVNGVYQMFVESRHPVSDYWSTGRATSSTPNGPYILQETNIAAFKINGMGSNGGYTGWHDGLKYNIFFHANQTPEIVKDEMYFTSTSDLITYSTEQIPTIGIGDDIMAYDQTADSTIFTDGTKVYFDYSALDNRTPFFAGIIRCEFNGTYDQFKKDLTIIIGAEQAL